jgi:hypothetical protein
MAMDNSDEGRITHYAGYVRVDFRGCNSAELAALYRAFAELCLDEDVSRALLKAGDEDPSGHYLLRDALSTMARRAAIRPDFKLALMASTRPIEAVYREAQQHLRAAGFNAWVFGTETEALEWLEDRSVGGRTAS